MSLHCFFIPARQPEPAQNELNAFLAAHRVLAVQREWLTDGAHSGWAFCGFRVKPGVMPVLRQALMDGWRGPNPHPNPPPLGEGARPDRPALALLLPAGGGRVGGFRGQQTCQFAHRQPTLDTTLAIRR